MGEPRASEFGFTEHTTGTEQSGVGDPRGTVQDSSVPPPRRPSMMSSAVEDTLRTHANRLRALRSGQAVGGLDDVRRQIEQHSGRSSTWSRAGSDLRPEREDALRLWTGRLSSVMEQRGALMYRQAQQRARAMEASAVRSGAVAEGALKRRTEGIAEFEGRMAQLNADVRAWMDKTVNPSRIWDNVGGMAKIAVFLGGAAQDIGNRLAGRPAGAGLRDAVNWMNTIIQRDVALQTEKLTRERSGLQAQGTVIGEMYELFGDKQRAHDAYEHAMRLQGLAMMEAQAERDKGSLGSLAAKEASASMQAKLAQDLAIKTMTRKTAGSTDNTLQKLGLLARLGTQQAKAAQGAVHQLPDSEKKGLKDGYSSIKKIAMLMQDVKKNGGSSTNWAAIVKSPIFFTDDFVTEAQRSALTVELAKAFNGGRPSDADAKALSKILPSAKDSIFQAMQKVMRLEKWFADQLDGTRRSFERMDSNLDLTPLVNIYAGLGWIDGGGWEHTQQMIKDQKVMDQSASSWGFVTAIPKDVEQTLSTSADRFAKMRAKLWKFQ